MASLLSTRTARTIRIARMVISGPVAGAEKVITRLTHLKKQIQFRLRGAPDGLPIPPDSLITLVAGTNDISWFLEAGRRGAESITRILERNGIRIGDLQAILDFGCGCGRVIRYFGSLRGPKLCGCDYNAVLIEWCRRNLTFAQFDTNHLRPPLPYADVTFDFIYALSVFTHLPEAVQLKWMEELSRVLKPGGCVLITTHGEAYLEAMRPEEAERFRSGLLATRDEGEPGSNAFAAYHPPTYVREKLANAFEVIDFVPEGAAGNPRQDAFLLRKPQSTFANDV